jgi:hypothetical protein
VHTEAAGIVEHAVLLGTPIALRPERWAMARAVVSGRLINGFSHKDWLLGVVYRGTAGFVKDAAGLGPAPYPGVENVNLTSLVQVHPIFASCCKPSRDEPFLGFTVLYTRL